MVFAGCGEGFRRRGACAFGTLRHRRIRPPRLRGRRLLLPISAQELRESFLTPSRALSPRRIRYTEELHAPRAFWHSEAVLRRNRASQRQSFGKSKGSPLTSVRE